MTKWAVILQAADLLTFLVAVSIYGMSGEYGMGAQQAFSVAGLAGVVAMKAAGVGIYLWAASTGLGAVVWSPFGHRICTFKSILLSAAIFMGALGTAVNSLAIGISL